MEKVIQDRNVWEGAWENCMGLAWMIQNCIYVVPVTSLSHGRMLQC